MAYPLKNTVPLPEGSWGKTGRTGSSCEFTKPSCWCMNSGTWKEKKPAQLHSSGGNSSSAVAGRWWPLLFSEQQCLLSHPPSPFQALECSWRQTRRHSPQAAALKKMQLPAAWAGLARPNFSISRLLASVKQAGLAPCTLDYGGNSLVLCRPYIGHWS